MSVVSVYRTFYWVGGRLRGLTNYVWETKEEQARCIKEPSDLARIIDPTPYIPPTEDQQRRDARYHIANQHCLCGIHGYFSPNYLSLMLTSGNGPGAVDREGELVYTRVRLGGLVDIHGMGARGEYGLIEEAWCNADIGEAIAKQYDIPVNQSEYEKQPRTDPILDGDTLIKKLAPLFADLSEIVNMQNSLGVIPGPSVGVKVIPMSKVVRSGTGPLPSIAPLLFRQSMNLMGVSVPPPPAGPFGALGGPQPTVSGFAAGGSIAPGNFGPPPVWTSQMMRSMWNANNSPPAPCSAPSGSSCQCGACAFRAAMGPALGSWKCPICGTFERQATDHTWRICAAALLQIVLVKMPAVGSHQLDPPKESIVTRLKRALGWGS